MTEAVEKLGIDEIKELLVAIGILGAAGVRIGADGKIGADDLVHLIEVAKKANELIDGFKDLDVALAQAKDIDEAEALALLTELFAIIKMVKKAKEDMK